MEDFSQDADALVILARTPEIIAYGDVLTQAIRKACKITDERVMANVQLSLSQGLIQCWIVTTKGMTHTPVAIIVTGVTIDLLFGYRNFLVYGIYGIQKVENEVWTSAFIVLEKYAKAQRCDRIVAFTDNKRVTEIARLVGARTELVMMEKEL